MSDARRATAREIADRYLQAGDPLGWFEALYARADDDPSIVPWADLAPNPNLRLWLDKHRPQADGRRALKVGCGLGDDAELLAQQGFQTTAFDISATAIAWCRRRFPQSAVTYVAADVLQAPRAWQGAFDFVLESYTLQVLPPEWRAQVAGHIASFVAPGGTLLVIARGREASDPAGKMPWPLAKAEMLLFQSFGLQLVEFDDFLDAEDPPVRRFRASFARSRQATAATGAA